MKSKKRRIHWKERAKNLAMLKALFHLSIQVADKNRNLEFPDILKKYRKMKANSSVVVEEHPEEEENDPPEAEPEIKVDEMTIIDGVKENVANKEKICDRKRIKRWRRPPKKKSKGTEGTERDKNSADILSMQQQLALTALNLTAPACSSILNNHRKNWVQLSGHPGSLAPAGPCTIWKKQPRNTNETWVYEALMQDSAKDFVPRFYNEIFHQGQKYIEISDLLYGFNNPCVMDVKMGTRTFLENEVSNTTSRNDLYLKLVKLDRCAPTQEEHSNKAMTKLRYMDLRDTMSSSRSLGFRVDALKMSSSRTVTEIKKVRTESEVVETLNSFLQKREATKRQILSRLKAMREVFEKSKFFKHHEVIGSSILIVYDAKQAGAWIIDFAKTCPLPEGVKVNHRTRWTLGNHEEGYLTGLDNLIEAFEATEVNKKKKLNVLFGKKC